MLQGFGQERDFNSAIRMLSALECIDLAGRDIALEAARNVRLLRSRGITIRKTIDTLIATRCIADGIALLFSDRDFQPFVDYLGLASAI